MTWTKSTNDAQQVTQAQPAYDQTALFLPQIRIVLVQPVLAGRREDVEAEGVFERFGFVWYVGRKVQHFACADDDFLAVFTADPEPQRALQDVAELLVVVVVQ